MSVAEILDDLAYGPAPESDAEARAWLAQHPDGTRLFIDGEWREPQSGQWFDTRDPATGDVLARVAEAGETDVDAAVTAARHAWNRWADAPRTPAGAASLRHRPSHPEEQPPVRGDRVAGQRQADPRDPRHRRAAGRAALLLPRRVGAGDGDRACRPGAGRGLRPDHPVELSAPDARLEDRSGDCARQHGGAEAGRIHAAHRPPLRRHLQDGRAAQGRGQHRHRGRGDRRADRPPQGHRQARLHRLDRGRPENPRGLRRLRQGADAGTRRQVAVHRLRRRRPRLGGGGGGRRHLVQPGPGLLRRLAAPRPGVGARRLHRQAEARGSRRSASARPSTRRSTSAPSSTGCSSTASPSWSSRASARGRPSSRPKWSRATRACSSRRR